MTKKEEFEKLGYDAAINGPNTKNTHFSIFATPERSAEWQKGFDKGVRERQKGKL